MQSNDLLESDQFDPVECLNLLFPNEASLWMVNTVAGNLDDQIRQTDDEIRTVMRTQVDTDSQSMSKMRHAQLAVQDLYSSISTMKQRAESSEDKVLGITHDIKALDSAKRNLVTAVTLLKRLHMLATATEQLYSICERDNYKEAFHLLLAVQELYDFFEEYRQIPEVVELCNNVDSLKRTLSQKIRKEFEAGFNVQGVWTGDKVKLTGACEIMDLVDTADRERMVDTYCSLQLKPYIAIFKPHDEVSSLDNVSRRYAWLRRVLRTHDEEYGTVFPSGWHVAQRLCEKFAITTRNQLADVLKNAQKGLDVGEILRGLQLTRSFEHQLERRFKAALPTPRANPQSQDDNIPKESDTTTSSPFHHIISQCFEPYLSLYTASEDKKIMTLLESFKAQSSQVNEDPSMPVLSSASDLLYLYRDALDKCASFSTGKPLLELAHIFAKGLLYYANDVLLGKLPKLYTVDERRPMSHDELTHICWTINTADYCHRSTAQLETKIVNQLDPALADQVQFTAQQDAFLNTIHTSLKSLIRGVESCCESAFSGMLKIPWATLEAVGDQSDYVSMVASAIHLCLGVIRRTLTNDRYIRSFCDKFAEAFTAKFLTTVQRCRQISEVGAEQMLLDIQAIKTVLLDMP
ncbi:Vacuolar protein sorting-associated protein 53, partial [Dispira parvispora]